jgi:hypothetical protein
MTAFTLEIAPSMNDEHPLTVGYFESRGAAADHYGTRDDLADYFWRIGDAEVPNDCWLPYVLWPRKRVARATRDLKPRPR